MTEQVLVGNAQSDTIAAKVESNRRRAVDLTRANEGPAPRRKDCHGFDNSTPVTTTPLWRAIKVRRPDAARNSNSPSKVVSGSASDCGAHSSLSRQLRVLVLEQS